MLIFMSLPIDFIPPEKTYEIRIVNEKGEVQINLTPVREYINTIEQAISTEENRRQRVLSEKMLDLIDRAKKMDKKQLEYVIINMFGIIERWVGLHQSIADNPKKFLEDVEFFRKYISPYRE